MNPETMNRPDLIAALMTKGFSKAELQFESIPKLRSMLLNGSEPKAKPVETPKPPMAEQKPPVTVKADSGGGKMAGIMEALVDDVASQVTAQMRQEMDRLVGEIVPRSVQMEIRLADDEIQKIDLGIAHEKQATLIQWLAAGVHCYLYGPAGSGKTTAARKSAKALGELFGREVPFYAFSADETMQTHNLLGFMLPNGDTVRTPFRDAFENGGVFLIDELDTAPGLLTVLNMALDNKICAFPDKIVTAHKDFRCVGGGNTVGKGATSEYVARNRQDAATMNRFAFINWDYDETLELHAAGADQKDWVKHVQKIRKAHRLLGVSAPDILVSPRASIYGAMMLRTNPKITFNELEESLVWQGASEDDKAKLRAKMK